LKGIKYLIQELNFNKYNSANNFNVKGMGKVSAVADPYAGYSGLSK
jgi:hypothetical protein